MKGRPDDVRAWRDYLAMLLEQGDLDTFLALLRNAPKSADSEPETWMFRGVACEKAGDCQAAAEFFRKAIELNPYGPKYYYRLAMAEERLGLREEAIAHRKRTQGDERGTRPVAGGLRGLLRQPGRGSKPPHADLATAYKHLASICETLGWSRAAQAWDRLSQSSGPLSVVRCPLSVVRCH